MKQGFQSLFHVRYIECLPFPDSVTLRDIWLSDTAIKGTSRLHVEQYRLIQKLCRGTGVVGATGDVGVMDDAEVTDIVGVTHCVGVMDGVKVTDVVVGVTDVGVTDIVKVTDVVGVTDVGVTDIAGVTDIRGGTVRHMAYILRSEWLVSTFGNEPP